MLIKALVAWMRSQNCSRDEQGIQMEVVVEVRVESSPEELVVLRSAGRLRFGGCSFGCGRRKRSTEKTGESCKKGMTFSIIHATENSREKLVKLVKRNPLKCFERIV